MVAELRVESGSLLCLRLFDVGDEVRLDEAAALLGVGTSTIRRGRDRLEKMATWAVPHEIERGVRKLKFASWSRPLDCAVAVHFFDSGTISVCFTFAIETGTTLEALAPLCGELQESPELEKLGRAEIAPFVEQLRPAIDGFHEWAGVETYTIIHIHELAGRPSAAEVLAWAPLAKLIVGEPSSHALGHHHREEILEHAFGYLDDDLVVVDWNCAFVLDPRRDSTLIGMLEYANSHLLNLRYYDAVLDTELRRIYAELEAVKHHKGLVLNPYARLSQTVFRNLVGVSEVVERIDNGTKVVGDFYAARVYRAAISRLRVGIWNDSIERKQRLVNEAYSMMKAEAEARRGLILELTIILLIVVEIVLALLGHV